MASRKLSRVQGMVVGISEPMAVRVRATAGLLGLSAQEVVEAGCRLICAYAISEVEPRVDPERSGQRGVSKCQSERLVKALALALGSRKTS